MQLIAKNLACDRGDTRVFEGISFALNAGEGLTVTGPNGAGKSTLLRVMAGFLPASEGQINLGGTAHYLGPENAMKPPLTVLENLTFWQKTSGDTSLSVEEALTKVGLQHVAHVPFSDLSTGQKRRIAIARLFLNHRQIWLLDEPTSGLDSDAEQNFAGFVKEHLANGGIVVAATHLPIDVAGMKKLRFAGGAL